MAVPTPEDRFDDAPDVFTEEDLLSDESIFIVVVVRRGRDGRDRLDHDQQLLCADDDVIAPPPPMMMMMIMV